MKRTSCGDKAPIAYKVSISPMCWSVPGVMVTACLPLTNWLK